MTNLSFIILFTLCLLCVFLILYVVVKQNERQRKALVREYFFKTLDFHREHVQALKVEPVEITIAEQKAQKGKHAFIEYKYQLGQLLEIVQDVNQKGGHGLNQKEEVDIAYICFYYGIDNRWHQFSEQKLKAYKNNAMIAQEIQIKVNSESGFQRLGRTNQTDISGYFRNMFYAIELVEQSRVLSQPEKLKLIQLYRAQLSNPELYVLYFHLISRFGKDWRERRYVERFDLLKNLPLEYCDGYQPRDFFELTLAEEELFN